MDSVPETKKVLLMGKHKAGKTSMRSIIFGNNRAFETSGLGYTVNINEGVYALLSNLTLNLWDCGG